MAEDENELLAISVDPDDYASTAAGDTPSTISRTYQSEDAFLAQKVAYKAKIDGGQAYYDLIAAVPILSPHGNDSNANGVMNGAAHETVVLTKKDVQLLGYAVGELYLDGRFKDVVELCSRVRKVCVVDERLGESLERWVRRCRERSVS